MWEVRVGLGCLACASCPPASPNGQPPLPSSRPRVGTHSKAVLPHPEGPADRGPSRLPACDTTTEHFFIGSPEQGLFSPRFEPIALFARSTQPRSDKMMPSIAGARCNRKKVWHT